MNWPACTCDSPGWCNRHFQNKDTKQWLQCLKYDGCRHALDFQYGISPQQMTNAQKLAVVRHIDMDNFLRKFIYDYEPKTLDRCKILLLGHTNNQYAGEARDYLEFHLLQDLDLGTYKQYQNNCFAESRVYLSDVPDSEYIGVVTASWNDKFIPNRIDQFHEWENTKILFNSKDKNIILTAERSMFKHNSIFDLFKQRDIVKDFSDFATALTGEICNFGVWSNQIICHRDIYLDLQRFYKRVFPLIVEKIHSYKLSTLECYGMHGMAGKNIHSTEGFNNRKAGLFFEFLTNVWFASQKDLIILPNGSRKRDWYDCTSPSAIGTSTTTPLSFSR